MNPRDFDGTNMTLGKPQGWDEESYGPCQDIRVQIEGSYVTSCWQPDAEELERLNAGMPVFVRVVGHSMPPMLVEVGVPSPSS